MLFLFFLACRGDSPGGDDDSSPGDTTTPTTDDTALPDGVVTATAIPGIVLAQKIAVSWDRDATADIVCTDGGHESHRVGSTELSRSHDFALYGLLAETTYTCVVTGGKDLEVSFTTASLPSNIPDFTVTQSGTMTGAYTLFNHFTDATDALDPKLLLVDPEGNVRWYYDVVRTDGESHGDIDCVYLGEGLVLYGGAFGIAPTIVDLRGGAMWVSSSDAEHHHVALQVGDTEVLSLTKIVNTDGAKKAWTGFGIEITDWSNDEETWSWSSQTAVDSGFLPATTLSDPYHANSAVYDATKGTVTVLMRNADKILTIDRATGDVLWAMGRWTDDFAIVDAKGNPASSGEWFYAAHGLNLEGDRILLFDNGINRTTGEYSRAVEYTFDLSARTLTPVWSYTEDHWLEPVWGDADWLGNDRVLVSKGHCDGCPDTDPKGRAAILEIDRADGDRVVWRLDFPNATDALYQAERIDGCAIFSNERYCAP